MVPSPISQLMNLLFILLLQQVRYDRVLNSSEDTGDFDDDIIDMDALLDEDTFMPTATW